MIGMRYRKIIILLIVMSVTIYACDKKEEGDLFEEQQEELLLEGDTDAQSEGITAFSGEEAFIKSKYEDKDKSQEKQQNEDKLQNEDKQRNEDKSQDEDKLQNHDKPQNEDVTNQDITTQNELQGEAMETLGQSELLSFNYVEISNEIKTRIVGKSYGEDCDVPFEELRYVNVLYWGFDGQVYKGELIVNQLIAEDIVDIFKELYELKYPMERMVLVDEYDADDNASMEANNSSAFNYRAIDDGSKRLSLHSYGMAIDINPLYNPYVRSVDGDTVVSPEGGTEYADRTLDCPYYIEAEDPCYLAFTKRGFTWGGDWKNQKDYQHFQKALQ